MNRRPSGPQPDALPGCATPRCSPEFRAASVPRRCEHVFGMRDGAAVQKCYSCGELKPADQLAWRRKQQGQRDSFCRPCRSAYHRKHYAENRRRYVAQAGERKRRLALERTKYLLEYFRAHPCTDCGEGDPVVLEFDHIGEDKLFDIAQSLPYRSWQSILNEMQKCEVVCANCHRRRTAERRGALRHLLRRAGAKP